MRELAHSQDRNTLVCGADVPETQHIYFAFGHFTANNGLMCASALPPDRLK